MKPTTTACWCDDEAPTFDPDYEFVDETGFECMACGANVYYQPNE